MLQLHYFRGNASLTPHMLLEELGVPYDIQHHMRDAVTNLAPPALLALHPLGKSPMIEDNGRIVAESGAIVEYLCERHGGEAMIPARGSHDHVRYLELIHFAEGSVMTPVLLALYTSRLGEAAAPLHPRINEQLESHFEFMEGALQPSGYFIGDSLTGADIMLSFPAEVARAQGRTATRPKLAAFVEMIHARPAWKVALEKGGAYNFA